MYFNFNLCRDNLFIFPIFLLHSICCFAKLGFRFVFFVCFCFVLLVPEEISKSREILLPASPPNKKITIKHCLSKISHDAKNFSARWERQRIFPQNFSFPKVYRKSEERNFTNFYFICLPIIDALPFRGEVGG